MCFLSGILGLAFFLWALIDLSNAKYLSTAERTAWAIGMFITGGICAIFYATIASRTAALRRMTYYVLAMWVLMTVTSIFLFMLK